MVRISQRLRKVPSSPIRKLVPLADEAKKRGVDVIHLNIGDPDIAPPAQFIERLRLWKGGIPYAHSQGDAELLDSLLGYYRGLGFGYLERDQIQVTVGGSEALAMAMAGCCEPGDEIIVFEPFFTGYASLAPVYGVKLVPVTTRLETGFHLPGREVVESKITAKTKAILLTNPNNPTGTVYRRNEVEMLVSIAADRGLWLWSDEVYREFSFGEPVVSLFEYMQDNPDNLVVLDSLSKRYSAPGLRLGMLVSLNTELMAGVLRMAMGRLSAGIIDQRVAAQLKQVSSDNLIVIREEYRRRRDVVYEGLKDLSGVTIREPEGAFYCVVELPVPDAEAFCAWMLTDFEDKGQTVMLAPMAGFYATPGMGKNEVRLAYVVGVERLQRSVELLKLALKRFQ